MTVRLLLDEHYSEAMAASLRELGHDVASVVAITDLRGASDDIVFRWAAAEGRRIVTENVKDFRPLLLQATAAGGNTAPLLLVSPRRFPRSRGRRADTIVAALDAWLAHAGNNRTIEDWLT